VSESKIHMPEDNPEIEDVLVVGGGDAGLMTALTLESASSSFNIQVVDEFDEPVPRVGKSTISYILHTFHDVLGIDRGRFIREVRPVWKASIRFDDWCGHGPFQSPFDTPSLLPEEPGQARFEELYHRYQTDDFHTFGGELSLRGLTPFVEQRSGSLGRYDHVAYHLNTDNLNTFLRTVCQERGITLVDDRITDVTARNTGSGIEAIHSGEADYEADLYIDATSFERALMSNLDVSFNSFATPLDSAAVIHVDRAVEEIVPATVVTSGGYGWRWQIDTLDSRSLGYVYSSEHVSDEEAIAEFVRERNEDFTAEDVGVTRFDSGHYRTAWSDNCIAVGNALGFVEPLQSTALTLNAVLTEKLAELITAHDRINHGGLRHLYNEYAQEQWTNVHDFITLHYKFADGDTQFWEDVTSLKGTDGLAEIVESYYQSGFTSYNEVTTGTGTSDEGTPLGHSADRHLFDRFIFYRMLQNLDVPSAFYEKLEMDVSRETQERVEQTRERIVSDAGNHITYEQAIEYGVFE
jgi:tryptophan halogenase